MLNQWRRNTALAFWKLAASGALPARWFLPELPATQTRAARTGPLHIEVVSHCWNYSHLLVYQLSSLLLHPPSNGRVTMSVFYSEEDRRTVSLLEFIDRQTVTNVQWNWLSLPRESLFRRSIGRNQAALASTADWIWFTDCDLVFGPGCLDQLQQLLQGSRAALVYPAIERVTTLLDAEDPLLQSPEDGWSVREVDTSRFQEKPLDRATGPMQITHGDVARAVGYCRDISRYQTPEPRFAKCHEDRAFRWLLRSQGTPIPLDKVFRIRHAEKGRYREGRDADLRGSIRRWQDATR